MIKTLLLSVSLVSILTPSIAFSFSLPEIDFCPLGGPPGWFNRMTGQHNQRYYRPPPAMFRPQYPAVAPNVWQTPVRPYPPGYFQQYPAVN